MEFTTQIQDYKRGKAQPANYLHGNILWGFNASYAFNFPDILQGFDFWLQKATMNKETGDLDFVDYVQLDNNFKQTGYFQTYQQELPLGVYRLRVANYFSRGLIRVIPYGDIPPMLIFGTDQTTPETVNMSFTFGSSETMNINWGDGTEDEYTGTTIAPSHTYTTAGVFSISIRSTSYEFIHFITNGNKFTTLQVFQDLDISRQGTALLFLARFNINLFTKLDFSKVLFEQFGNNDDFDLGSNPNLNEIIFKPGTKLSIMNFLALPELEILDLQNVVMQAAGNLFANNNAKLKQILHSTGDNVIQQYLAFSCNLQGVHDMTTVTFTTNFRVENNTSLENITFNTDRQVLSGIVNNPGGFNVSNCNLTGTFTLTKFYFSAGGLNQRLSIYENSALTKIVMRNEAGQVLGGIFGYSCGLTDIENIENVQINRRIVLDSNNLGFLPINLGFSPLSISDNIRLQDNGMTAAIVNQYLVHFDELANQPEDWILNIAGTNAAPDATSGGYDGLTALNNLQVNKNWNITVNS